MIQKIFRIYSFIFSRKIFFKWNTFVYNLGLRGLGILNYTSMSESGEISFLRNFCKQTKNPIIFDIGANKGSYSKTIRLISNTAEIFMFEPHPITFQSLQKEFKQNNFQTFNLACGKEEGFLNLYDYADKDNSSHATLVKDVIENIHQSQSKKYKIEVITLDKFIDENEIKHIDLLKIDAEGYELNILKGCQKSIRKNKVDIIQLEFTQINSTSRTFMKDFFDILCPQFELFRLLPNNLLALGNYNPIHHEIFAYQNIVAIRKDATDAFRSFNI